MPFNKPIWSPNVILMNVTKNANDITLEAIELIKNLSNSLPIIGIYIDHEYQSNKKSQIILSNTNYSIYKETFKKGDAVTSKLLNAGVKHVYCVVPKTKNYRQAFIHMLDLLGFNFPILCIASGLALDIDPAVMVEFGEIDLKKYPNRMLVSELNEKEISFKGRNFIIE